MTIAEQIMRAKTDYDEVYHAGKLAVLKESEALQGTPTGTVVTADDVSSVEHSVSCKLSSDTITDFSTVTVSRYGKNLFDKDNIDVIYSNVLNFEFEPTENGIRINFHSDGSPYIGAKLGNYDSFIGKTLCFSMKYNDDLKVRYTRIYVRINDSNIALGTGFGTGSYAYATIDDTYKGQDAIIFIRLCNQEMTAETKDSWIEFNNMQLELGSTPTAYTPYIEPTTYHANSDGTVDGITSIAPSMTLLTNAEGIVINANYYKDPDIVISNLQQAVAMSGGE